MPKWPNVKIPNRVDDDKGAHQSKCHVNVRLNEEIRGNVSTRVFTLAMTSINLVDEVRVEKNVHQTHVEEENGRR